MEIEYNKERQTVYFDMPDVRYIIFADEKEHTALHEGDDIVIKISKLPIKNKLAGATANISGVSTEVLDDIKARKNYIKSPSMLYEGESDYIEIIKDRLKYTTFDIVTDIKEVYEKILSFLKENHSELADRVRLYEDQMITMNKLYSIDTLFESDT